VYLERAVLVALLRAIRRVAAPSSRFAVSFSMTPDSDAAAARQEWFRRRVAAVGEPERDRLTRDELTDCARQAGLANLTWLLPAESGFFQPLLMAQVAG
jgi:hypothetical protein